MPCMYGLVIVSYLSGCFWRLCSSRRSGTRSSGAWRLSLGGRRQISAGNKRRFRRCTDTRADSHRADTRADSHHADTRADNHRADTRADGRRADILRRRLVSDA